MSEPITVLITGVSGGGLGHELLKALKASQRTRYRLVACDMNPIAYGFGEADASYTLPRATDAGYLDALMGTAHREGAHVLIPGSEAELEVLVGRRAELKAAGLLLLANDTEVIAQCLDKTRTMRALETLGVTTPRWISATASALDDVPWPVSIVKPASGGGGSNLVFLAQSRDEVRFFADYIHNAGGTPMVQEYVGDALNEYTVGILHSLDGQLISSIALRRDILTPLSNRIRIRGREGGAWLAVSSGVSQGEIVDVPHVRSACERIATSLGSRGPLNIQLRVVGNDVVPFEINPRFSGTTCFRALAGCNEPDLLIRHHVLEEPLAEVEVRNGKALRGLQERMIFDV